MMSSSIANSLGAKLEETLSRLSQLREKRAQALTFPKLHQRVADVSASFGDQGSPPAPPQQQRIAAFVKLRRNPAEVGARDWRLIAWGLADECGKHGRAIEDGELFPVIEAKFDRLIGEGNLTRRMWFGLASSYFSLRPEQGIGLRQWERLRSLLLQGFERLRSLRGKQMSPQKWVTVFESQLDVFSCSPGKQLGLALARDQMHEVEEFRYIAQVPTESWLWKSVIDALLQQIQTLGDAEFIARIEPTLRFSGVFPNAADAILAALLQRYAQTNRHEQAHKALKDAALERWGSPQMGSARNRWSVNVAEPVCKMVMRWFAKEDLETFFKLLQGESGVDQDRLDYWLRFVGQIAYTRIVLGGLAANDRSADFVEFRKKNAKRISTLRGGTAEDNAFVMKVGGYIIVEFSKKGNACYVHREATLPFDLGRSVMERDSELKNTKNDPVRIVHNSRWQGDCDRKLAGIGIYPDSVSIAAKPSNLGKDGGRLLIPGGLLPGDAERGSDGSIIQAVQFARSNFFHYEVQDNRGKGGAFWITSLESNVVVENKFLTLGFSYVPGRGYWIK